MAIRIVTMAERPTLPEPIIPATLRERFPFVRISINDPVSGSAGINHKNSLISWSV
jgi:hypothetical protein